MTSRKHIEAWQKEMQQLFYEICLGVKCLHDKDIVHRDLSLENVLLVKNKSRKGLGISARICDFGLMEHSTKLFYDCVGKRGFMSPECDDFKYNGKANDVWCLGVMLFMMMIGGPPYGKLGDKAFQYLISGESNIKFLLQQYDRYHLVPVTAYEVLCGIFKAEKDRLT